MKTLIALFALAALPNAAFAESTGAYNSRYVVAQTLAASYGLGEAELSARLTGGRDLLIHGSTTIWTVTGRASGRRVKARTQCKRAYTYYNKYDRAYRNECHVLSLKVT